MTTRVFQWAADRAGCHYYRNKFPADAIKAGPNGDSFEFDSETKIPEEWREASGVTIVGQRVCLPGPSHLWQRWAREGTKRLVFEVDDNLFNVDRENAKAYSVFSQPDVKQRLIRNIQVSHTVTVSTEPLAEVIRRMTGHKDVRVIPNAVPDYLVDLEAEQNHTLGYLGSPTHMKDFRPVARHFRRFLENHPEASYHAIGWNSAEFMELNPEQSLHTPWIPNPELSFEAIDFSFGIAPLAVSVFNRSKSDIKFVELGALGIPTIATTNLPYLTIRHQENGILVKYDHEWGRALEAMYRDKDMRQELGRNAREYVRAERTTSKTRQMWEDAYRG